MSTKRCPSSNLQLKKVAYYTSKGKSCSNTSNLLLEPRHNNNLSMNKYQPSITFFNNTNDNKKLPLRKYTNSSKNPNSKQKKSHKDNKNKKNASCPRSTCSKSNHRHCYNEAVVDYIKSMNLFNASIGRNNSLKNAIQFSDGMNKVHKSSERLQTTTTRNLSPSSQEKTTTKTSFNNLTSFYNQLSKHLIRSKPNTSYNIKVSYHKNYCITSSNGTKETSTTDKAKNKTLSRYCDEISTPEELHYYYVNMLQNGNDIGLKFDKAETEEN